MKLLASAVLATGLLAGLTSAQGSPLPTQGPLDSLGGGACAHTQPMGGGSKVISHFACTCSGAGPVLQGETQIGPFSVGFGTQTPADSSDLVCETVVLYAEYDAYAIGGNSTVVPGLWVENLVLYPECKTSGCRGFLFLAWGSPSCSYGLPEPLGGHQSYVVTGEPCAGEPPLPSSRGYGASHVTR